MYKDVYIIHKNIHIHTYCVSIYPYTRLSQELFLVPTMTKRLLEKQHPPSPCSNRSSSCLL